MKITHYHLIDKNLIGEGDSFPFKIFRLDDDKKSVSTMLLPNTKVNKLEWQQLQNKTLYIHATELEKYEEYLIKHLKTVTKKASAFTDKARIMLNKAEQIMHELFTNPETLGNVSSIEEIVDDLIATILNQEFTITSLMELAAHDYYTHTHSINVTIYALSMGKYIKLPNEELKPLGEAALMHDLGKSKVRTDVLNKHGRLTSFEFDHMKKHSQWSYDIAKEMGVTDKKILYAIKHHHEKINGTGYPDHIKTVQISLFARIICICDIFDALTTKRSYKNPVSTYDTLQMMKHEMAHEIDERLLNSFILMMHS